MKKIKVAIAGGAGYTAGELLRILLNHPLVEIGDILSESNAGNKVAEVHEDLFYTDLQFTDNVADDHDILFVCRGHGASRAYLEAAGLPEKMKIIDLSQDFRHKENKSFASRDFVYGLPEAKKKEISEADNIANPGCFATCIQLGLLPLARENMLQKPVQCTAITGSTGAGQKPSATGHFSWRNNNLSVYKPFQHQHLKEIEETLVFMGSNSAPKINFIPYRGNFTRGIIASMYMEIEIDPDDAYQLYQEFFREHPFVKISKENIHLKQVVNSNFGLIHLEKHDNQLLIISAIDNLIKGASGQAVQNMNLIFGFPETEGLKLKASYF